MTLEYEVVPTRQIRLSMISNGNGPKVEMGSVRLSLVPNDGHEVPYGLVEDLRVHEEYRNHGVGGELLDAAIAEAKRQGCYKLLATSRNTPDRIWLHKWYKKKGFVDHGTEFRMDLERKVD